MSRSPHIESLFAAAREDAPSRSLQDGVWTRVAAETIYAAAKGGAANAAAGAAAHPAAIAATSAAIAPSAVKLLMLGAVLGATGAGGAFLLLGRSTGPAASAPPAASVAPHVTPSPSGAPVAPGEAAPAFELSEGSEASNLVPAAKPPSPSPASSGPPPTVQDPSALAEEARFVTEARRALVSGDPEGALVSIRRARRLPTRALEPEELALESRALRALGRVDEAWVADEALRRGYPKSALAR